MSLAAAITTIQTIAGELTGIRQAKDAPPEQLVSFPQAVAYPTSGELALTAGGWMVGTHTVALEFHTARKSLEREYSLMMPLIEALPKAIFTNLNLTGAISRLEGPITYSFGRLDWVGDVETVGWRFLLRLKQEQTLTVSTAGVVMTADQTLQDAVTQIQSIVGALPGIRQAPPKIIEKIGQFPFVTTYPVSGELKSKSAGWFNSLHTVATEFHLARKDLPKDYRLAIPYVEAIPAAIFQNINLQGQAETIVEGIAYTFGELDWVGDVKTIGWRFTTRLKLKSLTE